MLTPPIFFKFFLSVLSKQTSTLTMLLRIERNGRGEGNCGSRKCLKRPRRNKIMKRRKEQKIVLCCRSGVHIIFAFCPAHINTTIGNMVLVGRMT